MWRQVSFTVVARSVHAASGQVANELKSNGLLPEEGLATLHESCQKCRLALDSAAAAWEQGEMNELRARLAEYRSVAKAVRTELVRLAR